MVLNITKLAIGLLVVGSIAACNSGKSGSSSDESSSFSYIAAASVNKAAVRNEGITFSAPQFVVVSLSGHFVLNIPAGVTIASANWAFSDGGTATGTAPVDHQFFTQGANTVTVNVTDTSGVQMVFTADVTVIPFNESLLCISDLALNVPRDVDVGVTATMSVSIPTCLTVLNPTITWSYGDRSTGETGLNVSHAYVNAGDYNVTATVAYNSGGNIGSYTLTAPLTASSNAPPPPPNPNACPTAGQTRQITGSNYTLNKSCGVNGNETDTYRDIVTQTCMQQSDNGLLWQETSRQQVLVSAGQCNGQACALPAGALTGVGAISQNLVVVNGVYYIPDGQSLTFYSSQTPGDKCSTVATTRSCSNGSLGGSTDYKYLVCTNGCAGFGPDGTVKTGIVSGTTTVPHTCTFGETGVTDTYQTLVDQTCANGSVTASNSRQGALVTAGICPTYSWSATGTFTTCSAACGGTQAMTYVCKDNNGNVSDNVRCTSPVPVVTQVCDGNPASVASTSSQTTPDTSGSTNMCPANQIGVITQSRDMTVTTTTACVNHAVATTSTTTYSPWVTETYCRDFVAYRCSQDSLDNAHADGRYDWMIKCAPQVPVIAQFLQEFANVSAKVDGGNFKLGDKGRVLYPTFMYVSHDCTDSKRKKSYPDGHGGYDVEREHASGNHEHCDKRDGRNHDDDRDRDRDCTSNKVWIAPTLPTASCTVPDGVYVAAVCVSSCATPEQNIMTALKAEKQLKYMTFEEAWNDKVPLVATLTAASNAGSKSVKGTAVEQWVTELIDTEHAILEFHMQSGGVLRLTPNHTLLGMDAMMHLASDFKVGDSLVQLGFKPDKIVAINPTTYFGKVYNVFVQSADPRQNIVITNGYLNGSAFFQNEGASDLNRDVLRIHLTQGVFGK